MRRDLEERLAELEDSHVTGDEPAHEWMSGVPRHLWHDRLAAWRWFVSQKY